MVEVLTAQSGVPTARVDGRYLHSPRDPVREARRAVTGLARRDPPCVVMLGFGLGYHAEALLDETDSTVIIVYEPNRELHEQLMRARDLSGLLTSPRMVWTVSPDELQAALLLHAAGGFDVFTLNSRRAICRGVFDEADSVLSEFRGRVEINTNTLRRFGHVWVRNLCRNIQTISAGRPITLLKDAFDGIPGLLLAAGPTLDQILPALPELAERTLVVAVDTAVTAAQSVNVEPDIAVVVDPQYWNTRHLDSVSPGSTLLVSESSAHPAVFRHFSEPHLFCSSLFPLGRALESVIGPMGPLGAGGSVSTTAWDLLRYVGSDPIYVAGLDLGFPGGRTHYRGSFFETAAVSAGHRTHPAESTLFSYVTSGAPFTTRAAPSGSVTTDRRMAIYRQWFAEHLDGTSRPQTLSVTSGGAEVAGLTVTDSAAVLRGPEVRHTVRQRCASVSALDDTTRELHHSGLRDRLQALAQELGRLETLGKEALRVLDAAEERFKRTGAADLAPLARVDAAIERHAARDIAGFLMQGAIGRIRAGFGSGNFTEHLEASRALYTELWEASRYHAKCFRNAIQDYDSS